MYAKLKPAQILGKNLDVLNVCVVNYSLGSFKPTLGYSILGDDQQVIIQGTMQLDKQTYESWTTNDEILLQYVATQLNIEVLEIPINDKSSEDFLNEDPSLETR
jgi:hypothetical protein